MPTPLRLVLSDVKAAEVDRVYEFIQSQRSRHLVMHSQQDQAEAAASGLLFQVRDEENAIVATALVVPVGDTAYHEMGNCFVSERWRGFRLQRILILVRAAALVVAESPSQRLVTGVDPTNTRSTRSVIKAGFRPLTVRVPELFEHCSRCPKRPFVPPGRECCCDFFVLEEDCHRALVKELLSFGRTVTLTNRQGKRVELELASRCVADPEHRQILEAFVEPPENSRESC